MKTLQQVEKEIAELEKQREELVSGRLAPITLPRGDDTYYIGIDGVMSNILWSDARVELHKRGLVSTNKRDMEKVIALQEQWGQFTLKAIQIADGWEPDWDDHRQKKGYAYYDHTVNGFVHGVAYSLQKAGVIYLPTEAAKHLRDWANANVKVGG